MAKNIAIIQYIAGFIDGVFHFSHLKFVHH